MIDNSQKQAIIPKDLSSGPIDNSKETLSGFWEKSELSSNFKKENNVIKALEIIKQSSETIYIYTPRIASGELLLELENLQIRGIRIYLLVNDFDTHYKTKIFEKYGIVRGRNDITSTFIICDPEGSCKGIWFEGDLSSKNNSSAIIPELNSSQAYEAYCQFTHLWWKSEGDEIKGNKKLKTKKFHPKAPEYPSFIETAFRIDAIDKLVSDKIEEIGLSESAPEKATVFLDEAEKISLIVSEKSREFIEDADSESINGYHNLPFSFISERDRTIAFSGDIGFILDNDQKSQLRNISASPDWQYVNQKEIGEINGMILPSDSDWNAKKAFHIEEKIEINLDSISSGSVDEWQKGECRPDFPKKQNYAGSIEYRWKVIPPTLPENAKKHTLYTQWTEFESRIKKASLSISSDIEEYEKSLSKMESIVKANLISGWKEYTGSISETKWAEDSSIQKSEDALKKLEKIKEEIIQISSELKKEKSGDNEKNEYSESSGKKKNQKQSVWQKGGDKKVDIRKIEIPKKSLPQVGILYRAGNDDYLAVKYVDEIETAKEEVRNFINCRIVAEKSW